MLSWGRKGGKEEEKGGWKRWSEIRGRQTS